MPKVDQIRVIDFTDSEPNTWATKAPMPMARQDPGLAAGGNGKLYAIGGGTSGGMILATVGEYDPTTDTWATKIPNVFSRILKQFSHILKLAFAGFRLDEIAGFIQKLVGSVDPVCWHGLAPFSR
jgi:hypothetical protein